MRNKAFVPGATFMVFPLYHAALSQSASELSKTEQQLDLIWGRCGQHVHQEWSGRSKPGTSRVARTRSAGGVRGTQVRC
jgi:hypothetical protein